MQLPAVPHAPAQREPGARTEGSLIAFLGTAFLAALIIVLAAFAVLAACLWYVLGGQR